MKTDNGSAFVADATQDFLFSLGVNLLLSPPRMPWYNGSIEAGIGSLKTRTERHASRFGHPGYWTCDDVAAAQAEANATARPQGETGPTPDDLWSTRRSITPEERRLFQETVQRRREELDHQKETSSKEDRRMQREAIRRALVEHGILLFSRRRIPLPIAKQKTATLCSGHRSVLGAARGLVPDLGLRLNPLNYRVIFPLYAGLPIPIVQFAPLRRGLFIGFLRDLRASMPSGHMRAGLSRLIRDMETAGANWRGYYFQAERFLHYYYSGQLAGTELRMSARALGRRADFLLRNGLRVETKSWYYGWSTLGATARQSRIESMRRQIAVYLRRPESRLLIEFEGSIPTEVLAELQRLARTYNVVGRPPRLDWTIVRPITP